MKKTLIILVLCTLAVGAAAQTKKVVKTRTVNTQYIAQPAIIYFGIGGGEYIYSGTRPFDYTPYWFNDQTVHVEDAPYEYQSGIIGVQGGYLYSLYGDMNKSFTPYVGGEATLGLVPIGDGEIVVQAGLAAGVMIGSPAFRLDVRLQPQLTYFGFGEYEYVIDGYEYDTKDSSFRPNIALRVGAWIKHFNFYLQYNNTVSGGIGWRL